MSSGECNTKTQRHEDTKSEDDISHQIIGAAIEVHRTLGGPGLEVKATEKNHPIYETQVLTYLRLTGIKLGLLVNFGTPYVKDGISRIINGIL
jgi:PD-(D/E)XK nuclease superfamily